jgi:ribosomal protein S12 methylthiotransferase accessory factor
MPSAAKALCRALTEVAQLAGDFNSGGHYIASGLPKFARLEEAGYIIEPGGSIGLDDLPEIGSPNIKVEVDNCVQALAARGMQVFIVDVRHPLLGIPAFYTIVPGTLFRERAAHTSVAMISAKIVTETFTPPQAIARLSEFDQLMPNKYFIAFYLGQSFLNSGNHDQALNHFHRALNLEPPEEDLASIYTYLGISHKEIGRYQEALSFLGKADRIDCERTDTLNLMGFCYYKSNAYEKAVACFQRVIALNPSSAIDYANLASNYRAMGDKAKAIEYYHLALALDPTIEFARVHLTQLGEAPQS